MYGYHGFWAYGSCIRVGGGQQGDVILFAGRISIFDGCERYVKMGLIPGVSKLNKNI